MGQSALFSVSCWFGTSGAIISVSGTRRWSAWGATIFGTRGWSAWGATISVSGPFLAPKIEAGRGTCANGSRAGPNGNRDTWSDQRVRLERGRLSVRSLQLLLYCQPSLSGGKQSPPMGLRTLTSIIRRILQTIMRGVHSNIKMIKTEWALPTILVYHIIFTSMHVH